MALFIIAFVGAILFAAWTALWCCLTATNKRGTKGLGYFTMFLRYVGLFLMFYAVAKSL